MPTFDIIVPAYNASRYLSAAVESVLSQTYADWRIVLVNDGSTDETAEIAARFQQQLGDRMLVITQKNAGLPAARNAAIRASSAEFLAILDADDVWLPCRLAESLRSFELRPAAGLSFGLVTRIDEDGATLYTFPSNPQSLEGNIAPYIYMRKIELPCPTITFRRRCIETVGLFDETMRATEDRDLWLRIARQYEVAFIPKVIAYYRTSIHSMSGDLGRMLHAQLRFIRKHSSSPGFGFVARQVALSRAYKQYAEGLADRYHPWKAVVYSLRACFIWPAGMDNLRTAASLLLKAMHITRSSSHVMALRQHKP